MLGNSSTTAAAHTGSQGVMRRGAHSAQTRTAREGGVPPCPALPLDLLHRDDCEKINVSLFRDASTKQIQGRLWALATPDLTDPPGGDPRSSTFPLSRSRMSLVLQATVSEALRGNLNHKGPRAGMADTHGVPISLPTDTSGSG